MSNSIRYFATANVSALPGVQSKIRQFVTAATRLGYQARETIAEPGLLGQLALAREIACQKSCIIVFRCPLLTAWLYVLPCVLARLRGVRVILDVPTPLGISLLELARDRDRGLIHRIFSVAAVVISYPLALWPASLVVEYSEESRWFRVPRPWLLAGNGIDTNAVAARASEPVMAEETLRLVSVSSMAFWHGCDRLVRSLAAYRPAPGQPTVELLFIGDGPGLQPLRSLSERLGVSEKVAFAGQLTGGALDEAYEGCHAAVASLGLYRKRLNLASELKVREYACKGLPIILSAEDADLRPPPSFALKVPNDPSLLDVGRIVAWLRSSFPKGYSVSIRCFAEENLSYEAKIRTMLDLARPR